MIVVMPSEKSLLLEAFDPSFLNTISISQSTGSFDSLSDFFSLFSQKFLLVLVWVFYGWLFRGLFVYFVDILEIGSFVILDGVIVWVHDQDCFVGTLRSKGTEA